MRFAFLKSLRLHTKVSLAISLPCLLVSALVTTGLTAGFMAYHRREFAHRYQALCHQVASTLHELEVVTDIAGKAVLAAFMEQEDLRKFGTVHDLREFAERMGVSAIYANGADGFMTFWTHPPVDPTFNLFDICPEYQDFFLGEMKSETSPFVPVANAPSIKFFKSLSLSGDQILTMAIYSTFLDDLLRGAFQHNKDVIDIDVETPSGVSLRTGHPSAWHGTDGYARFSARALSTASDCCQCLQKGLSPSREGYFYNVLVDVSLQTVEDMCRMARMFGAAIFLCSAAASVVIARRLATHLVSRIESIDNVAANVFLSGDLNVKVPIQSHDDEIGRLSTTFNAMLISLKDGQEKALAHERASSVAGYARQVAHDIRSPLAAIRMALSDLGETSEETRRLLRNATFRIEDISNQLFEVNIAHGSQQSKPREEMRPVLLSSILELVVSEKRTEYRQHLHVDIEFDVDGSSYGVFVLLVTSDFKRVVSNLVNNAVESLKETGTVRISVKKSKDDAIVEVTDDGCGMPPHVLEKLGRQEISHGKENGHGIGVHSAQAMVKKFKGCITYDSREGVGTRAQIRLPLAEPPDWFLENLTLAPEGRIIIADDDVSIHGVWDERFRRSAPGIRIDHVSSPTGLADIAKDSSRNRNIFLVDFEFLGERVTGLDLIEQLNIAQHAVLVTSRFDEEEVLAGGRRLGLKMIPKSAAQHIPIRVQDPGKDFELPDALFLDDDYLIRKSWMMSAKRVGINLKAYATENELMRAAGRLPRTLPIYVDFDLNTARTGLDVAEALSKEGFTKIFLATGFPNQEFADKPWMAGVIGKEAPF